MSGLPDYETLVDGTIFGRPDKYSPPSEGLLTIVALIRYTTPDLNGSIELLDAECRKALTRDRKERIGNMTVPETLGDKVAMLPDPAIKYLLEPSTHEDMLTWVRFDPSNYVMISYGVLPKVLIDTGEILGSRTDAGWYGRMFKEDTFIQRDLGEQWCITLTMDGGPPPRQEATNAITYPRLPHLQHRVRLSGPHFNVYQALITMAAVYPILTEENIDRFHDVSEQMNDLYSTALLFQFYKRWLNIQQKA